MPPSISFGFGFAGARRPPLGVNAIGAESLMLLKKLPDEYTFKQTRLDEWYKGEVKNEPAWSLVELIKIIPQWLELAPPSAHLAAIGPSFDFVAQANAAAAARQGRGPLPPGYIPKGACFLCGEQNCYVDKCTNFCPTCKNKHCPGLVPSKKCVIHADTMPVGATTTRFDGKPVSDKTLAFLCDEWRKHKAGRSRAHAADGGPAEEGLSQEELGDLELDEYARAYAGSAEHFAPPQNFEWYSLDASSAETHLRHNGAMAADVDTVCASVADAAPAAPEQGELLGLTVSELDAAELDAAATTFLSAVSELDAAATAFLPAPAVPERVKGLIGLTLILYKTATPWDRIRVVSILTDNTVGDPQARPQVVNNQKGTVKNQKGTCSMTAWK